MKLDRVILDVLMWVKEQFWKAPSRSPVYVYEEISRFDSSRGYLKLVRRDTPRAIATWVFIPKRNVDLDNLKHQVEQSQSEKYKYDIYICCDHLFALTEIDSINKRKYKTKLQQKSPNGANRMKSHKISVLLISHFLNKDGTFQSFELFSQDYNLIKQGSLDPHNQASAIVQSVAMLLKYRSIDDWHFEIESYRKQFLGSSFTPTLRETESLAIGTNR
jgi:hypothetical protein